MGSAVKIRSITLTFTLLLGAACAKSEAPEPGPADGGTTDTQDAGPADAAPLAARYLVEPKGLFGDSPVNNRFLNPDFDLNAEGWIAYPLREGADALPTVQRRFETETPTRQPLLLMPKQMNEFGVGVVGTARAGAGRFDVSIWVGRDVEDTDDPVFASVIGLHPSEGERAWSLSAAPDSAVELGGRRWVQWRLRLEEGPVGFANLVVYDEGEAPLYLTGPVMLPATQMRVIGEAPAVRPAAARAVRPAEARANAALRMRFEKGLGARPRAPRLPRDAPRR